MSQIIKSIYKENTGYYNEITDYLDKYLLKVDNCWRGYRNYIYEEPINNSWLIRVPGATRGNIIVDDNNIILEINLYEDSFCYNREVLNNLDQFIGSKLVME